MELFIKSSDLGDFLKVAKVLDAMDNAPIGVFDSGSGGLSVWGGLVRGLPHESAIYYGEGKHCPFGDRTQEQIIEYTDLAVRRLLEQGVKLIVIACNAATAMAIDHLRAAYDVPFVGLEPAVKPAVERTKSGVVGVLATAATLRGRHFRDTSAKYADRVEIVTAVGEGFVELVEGNREDSVEAVKVVRRALEPLLDAGADHIVLGCTHYPFLAHTMQKVIGNRRVELIDPSIAIVKRVGTLLREHDNEASPDNKPFYEFMTSAGEDYRQKLTEKSKSLNL